VARSKNIPVAQESVVGCCEPLTEGELSREEATAAASVFGALSDPVRLRMLSLIAAESEVCSCALEEPLGKSQPTVSHHTKILSEAGLIVGERRGHWTWWRVVPSQLNHVARILTVDARVSG
jgi:ArsR family transcriptional regulator